MNKNRPILNIFNKKMVLYGDYISIYSKNDKKFIEYQNKNIEIKTPYELPQIINKKIPIKIKYYTDIMLLEIETEDYIDYYITNNYNQKVIRPGESEKIYINPDEMLNLYFKNEKTNDRFKAFFDYKSNEVNYNNKNIKNNLNEIYISGNNKDDIITKQNGNSLQLDIELLLNLDKVNGVEELDSGTHRKAFRINNDNLNLIQDMSGDIIKVARNKKGINSNKNEFKAWQSSSGYDELRSVLCPITSHGPDYKYIVMKDASVPSNKKITREDVDYIKSKITNYTDKDMISGNLSLDIRSDNIGYFNNKFVLIDYPYGGDFLTD